MSLHPLQEKGLIPIETTVLLLEKGQEWRMEEFHDLIFKAGIPEVLEKKTHPECILIPDKYPEEIFRTLFPNREFSYFVGPYNGSHQPWKMEPLLT